MFKLSYRVSARYFSSVRQHDFRVLFFGTDIIAQNVLNALHLSFSSPLPSKLIQNLEVVTTSDTMGKKNLHPVKIYCAEKNISRLEYFDSFLELHQPLSKENEHLKENWKQFQEQLSNLEQPFNIGVVCSFGYMIPSYIIECFSKGMYVIHPSLLPRYRGASPIQYTLMNGDAEGGFSIIEISKNKFDAGNIVFQESIKIAPTIRYEELATELSILGKEKQNCNLEAGNRLVTFLQNFDYYKQEAYPQSKSKYEESKAPKFSSDDIILKWADYTSQEIYNRYRAFYGSNFKTVKTQFSDQWYFIDEMRLVREKDEVYNLLQRFQNAKPGSIWLVSHSRFKNRLYVKCKTGWIEISGGYFEKQRPSPSYKFISKFLTKTVDWEDTSQTGHYFFS